MSYLELPAEVQAILAERAEEVAVFHEAAFLMGEEWAREHAHRERLERLNGFYRDSWQANGGEGASPAERPLP